MCFWDLVIENNVKIKHKSLKKIIAKNKNLIRFFLNFFLDFLSQIKIDLYRKMLQLWAENCDFATELHRAVGEKLLDQ